MGQNMSPGLGLTGHASRGGVWVEAKFANRVEVSHVLFDESDAQGKWTQIRCDFDVVEKTPKYDQDNIHKFKTLCNISFWGEEYLNRQRKNCKGFDLAAEAGGLSIVPQWPDMVLQLPGVAPHRPDNKSQCQSRL